MVSPTPKAKDLEDAFRHEVFKMLKAEGKINDAVIENMMGWHHSGFNIYCGPAIWPHDDEGLENLARYIAPQGYKFRLNSWKTLFNSTISGLHSPRNV